MITAAVGYISPPYPPISALHFSGHCSLPVRTRNCLKLPTSDSKRVRTKSMRAVVQRVASASVEVEGKIVSEIGPGLLVLVGIHESDTDTDAEYICRKVLSMRLFPNETTGKAWDQSGNKPDFHVAMPPLKAKPFYESLVDKFRKNYNMDFIKDGIFGAMMKVNLVNDGPVTMQLDSSQPSKYGVREFFPTPKTTAPETQNS